MTNPKINDILDTLRTLHFANASQVSTKILYDVGRAAGMTYKQIGQVFMQDQFKCGRGQFNITPLYGEGVVFPESVNGVKKAKAPKVAAPKTAAVFNCAVQKSEPQPHQKITAISNDDIFVPQVDPTFVQWGEYKNVKAIIESRIFFPLYISGLSGNGKTIMVEQVCAKLNREYIRVQISPETDEDDLIGGFRLINGETVFHKGPVIKAMEQGCVLLIDEIDRGSNKIMCLQGVLEGKPVLVKKIGQVIVPAPGFTVVATANTNGRGSDDGRYSAATVIDDAFIERFVATIEQPYPNSKIEYNIVEKHMTAYGVSDNEFVDLLVNWSAVIRKTFESGAVDELISTRRLCHIAKAYSIFKDRRTAIAMCIARFEAETREAFLDLYSKIDSSVVSETPELTAKVDYVAHEEVPF